MPYRPFERLDLLDVVAKVIASGEGQDPTEVATAVLARLGESDVKSALGSAVEAGFISDHSAGSERPDLYTKIEVYDLSNSSTLADAVVTAVAARLAPRGPRPPVELGLAQRDVARLSYPGWTFELVQNPDIGLALRGTANNLVDTRDQRALTRGRIRVLVGSVAETALRMILEVEEHETREHLRLGDRAALSPHSASEVPPPTNRRSSTG